MNVWPNRSSRPSNSWKPSVSRTDNPQINQTELFTSHEALLLEYEEALTRVDSTSNGWYDCSAHMLWIGERTRQVDGAHVEFLRGVLNPIGVKIGPTYDLDDVKRLMKTLNPDNEAGRITLITRLGMKKVEKVLPPLLRGMKQEGFNIVWSCDPMHANTYTAETWPQDQEFQRYPLRDHLLFRDPLVGRHHPRRRAF